MIIHFLLNENSMFCLQKGTSYISRRKPDLKQNPVIVVADPISKPLLGARRKHKISSFSVYATFLTISESKRTYFSISISPQRI